MATFRHWRIVISRWNYNNSSSTGTGDVRLAEWELYDAAGTKWPGASPTASESSASLGGAGNVFDGSTSDGARWISALNPGVEQWVQVDLGAAIDIVRIKIAPDGAANIGYHPLDFRIEGSSSGAFSGEQTVVVAFSSLATGWANNTLRELLLNTIAGTVLDDAGAPAARTVRIYHRATGVLVAQAVSNASTGAYALGIGSTDEMQVIVLDDVAGAVHQDLIQRAFAA